MAAKKRSGNAKRSTKQVRKPRARTTAKATTKATAKPAAGARPKMSDESVKKATGKTWDEWAHALDGRGAAGLPHAAITEIVSAYGAGPWWCQMVTVGYEQMRGMRVEHQTPCGFQVSATKTVPLSAAAAYRLWDDAKRRARWLPSRLTIRKGTPAKSLRITWDSDGTNVDVGFVAKGAAKCQVAVQHDKLPDVAAAERMQAFWRARLDALAASL